MEDLKLYMILLGCTPPGRNTEQHDIFFSIGRQLKDLVPEMISFWPEAAGRIHIDAWREVTLVGNYEVNIVEKGTEIKEPAADTKLFFINLGGYKAGEFDEFHYKMLVAARGKGEAIMEAKKTAFFRHTGFPGANSHVDDKYGFDVDDFFEIADILPPAVKQKYLVSLIAKQERKADELHLGYFILDKL
ncbi:MAG: hypothetical protein JWP81_4811 [Ferruginibacter sp.]|nr:hypothetical protein [Ferruginibacter sp.]